MKNVEVWLLTAHGNQETWAAVFPNHGQLIEYVNKYDIADWEEEVVWLPLGEMKVVCQ